MNPFANVNTTIPFENITDLWTARVQANPDKTFLYFHDKPYSYAEFDELTDKMAAALKAMGAQKGDHIALLIPNSPEFLLGYFGAMKGGFVAATLNSLLKADELEYILNDCDAEILITTPQYRKVLDPVWANLKKIKQVILTSPEASAPEVGVQTTAKYLYDLIQQSPRFRESDLKGSDKGSMIYTSGTTGNPKGVILTHANILYDSFIAHQLIDLRAEDTALCIMPLFHVNAQIASMMSTLHAGATVVLEEMFKPRSFIQTLKKYRCTTFSGVPTIYNFLNEMKEADGEDLSFLKACICGAAPMPVEVFNKFEEKFKGKIIEGYGLSEGTCVSSLNPLEGKRKIGSIGLSIPGQEMAIMDNDGKILPDGEIGEIVVRGPNVMRGYYKNDEANKSTIVDGWLHTGDLGYRDMEGYFFISGRKKEMIIQGGENIYPKEIEEVLYKHEAISECAIVGIPDKTYGEVVGAFIVPKHGSNISEKEIRNYLRGKIANFKMPKLIEVVIDLPKTATGKIQKNKIAEEYGSKSATVAKVDGNVTINYKWVYGKALAKFYTALKEEGKFFGIKCPKCGKVQCPPKSFCGVCYVECTEWVEVPNIGTLETYTTVHMEFPGQPMKPPYTFAFVKMDGTHTHVNHILGEVADKDIHAGMRVEPVWAPKAERKGNLHDIKYFRPVQ